MLFCNIHFPFFTYLKVLQHQEHKIYFHIKGIQLCHDCTMSSFSFDNSGCVFCWTSAINIRMGQPCTTWTFVSETPRTTYSDDSMAIRHTARVLWSAPPSCLHCDRWTRSNRLLFQLFLVALGICLHYWICCLLFILASWLGRIRILIGHLFALSTVNIEISTYLYLYLHHPQCFCDNHKPVCRHNPYSQLDYW